MSIADMARLAETAIQDGFDDTVTVHDSVMIRCSQCDATVINGVATHEHGCPNRRRHG